ncbi:MAG: hypothetical protein KAU38_06885 [Desulfobacterales bacterium]|nr:hypothetical protein [Desulfobacterales bacterium]
MKLKRKKPKIEQIMTTCSWCGLKIRSEGPIYAIGCKKRPEVDISKYESKVMPVMISTLGKTIWSIVPPADSDARKDGNDFMFTLCSEECGDQLKETLEIEKDLGELILSAEHIY